MVIISRKNRDLLTSVSESLRSEHVQRVAGPGAANRREFPVRPSIRTINENGDWLLEEYKTRTSELKKDIVRGIISVEFCRVIGAGYSSYIPFTFLPETLNEVTEDHLLKFLELVLSRASKVDLN